MYGKLWGMMVTQASDLFISGAPRGEAPKGGKILSRRTERTKGGGVVDERRSGVRTHHSRSRSESSMLMFGGSLSRTAVESASSNDAKDQSGNKFQRNQLAKNSRVLPA